MLESATDELNRQQLINSHQIREATLFSLAQGWPWGQLIHIHIHKAI